MAWQGWLTLLVVAVAFIIMVRGWLTPDMTLLGGAVTLAVAHVLSPHELVGGFASTGMLTVAALYVVAAGLRETGALDGFGHSVLPGRPSEFAALVRMSGSVVILSAFMNNTAVVAMLLPVVVDWCRRQQVPTSRLLMPLSFFTVLGGTCTLIGTSTNLVVLDLVQRQATRGGKVLAPLLGDIGFFEPAWFGVPASLLGVTYLLFFGRRLLPARKPPAATISSAVREYLVNMRVRAGSPLEGKRVDAAGLRHLPGLFLIEIVRGTDIIAPVRPDHVLQGGDRLTFTGQRSTIVDLERIPGLEHVNPHEEEQSAASGERFYCEAVVSATSPLIGRNIREANFRALYNAAVVAVHRGGEHLSGRVGDIVMQGGDTLMLQSGPHFRDAHANNPDFYLVSGVREGRPVRKEKAWLAFGILLALVALFTTDWIAEVVAAFVCAGAMILFGCISPTEARRGVQWNVLLTIAAALAVGEALGKPGPAGEPSPAAAVAHFVTDATRSLGPLGTLAAVYLLTVAFTELLTNTAAAVLLFPVAISAAAQLGVSPRPFVMAVLFAASLGFCTPIGYQTNLMVLGPGGYRFTDFLRVGLPLTLLLAVLAIILIPLIWPLTPV